MIGHPDRANLAHQSRDLQLSCQLSCATRFDQMRSPFNSGRSIFCFFVILKLPKCVLFCAPTFTTMCSTLVPGIIFEKMQNATHVASHVSKACCFANSHRFRHVFWAPPRMHFGKRKTDGKRCNITKHYVHSIKSVVVVCDFKLFIHF